MFILFRVLLQVHRAISATILILKRFFDANMNALKFGLPLESGARQDPACYPATRDQAPVCPSGAVAPSKKLL
jgi:hypothetical protein